MFDWKYCSKPFHGHASCYLKDIAYCTNVSNGLSAIAKLNFLLHVLVVKLLLRNWDNIVNAVVLCWLCCNKKQ